MARSCLLALLACALVASTVAAQPVIKYIPDNVTTTGTADNVLFRPGAARYQWNLIRGEIGPDAQHQKITELALVPEVTGTFTATWCQIMMGRGFTLGLTNCYRTNAVCPVVVYEGPLTFNGVKDTWSAIGLQRAYVTDGQSNVVVEIRYRGGSGTVPVRTSTGALGSRVWDNTSPDPYNNTCATGGPEQRIPRSRVTIDNKNVLICLDHNHLNFTIPLRIRNAPPLSRYYIAAAFGQGSNGPIDLGTCKVWLDFDPLTFYSLTNPNGLMFQGYQGLVGPNGSDAGTISWYVPNIPPLIGLCVAHAAVFLDRTTPTVLGCTNTENAEIRGVRP